MGKEREYSVSFVKWFSELSNKDISIAGGKGASLAEMYNNKFPIPPGFVITAQAYGYFIEKTGLAEQMKEILSKIDIEDTDEWDVSSKLTHKERVDFLKKYGMRDGAQDNDEKTELTCKLISELKSRLVLVDFLLQRGCATEDSLEESFHQVEFNYLVHEGNKNVNRYTQRPVIVEVDNPLDFDPEKYRRVTHQY